MANALYDKGREGFLTKQISWTADTVKAVLLDAASYTANLATHDFLDDVPAGARVGTPQTLGSKTATDGIADAADITFPTVAAGPALEYILVYQDTGVEATSRLIGLVDTATGLPVTPNGQDINVAWDNGTNKIFKL